MAKKSKKSNKKIILYVTFGLFVLGLASFAMIFLPALKVKETEDTIYNGLKVAFGSELANVNFGGTLGSLANAKINFSILGVLGFVLPFIAGALIALSGKKNKFIAIACSALFLAGAVLVFLLPTYTTITYNVILLGETTDNPGWVLQIGSILSGVFSILGSVGSCYFVIK